MKAVYARLSARWESARWEAALNMTYADFCAEAVDAFMTPSPIFRALQEEARYPKGWNKGTEWLLSFPVQE